MIKNDWLLSNLFNPTLDTLDLSALGELTTNNTQFLSKEDYLKSKFILDSDLFKDPEGNLSEEKFGAFYDSLVDKWNDFQLNSFPIGVELDLFDTGITKSSKVKDLGLLLYDYNPKEQNLNSPYLYSGNKYINPDRVTIGIEGWRTTGNKTKTASEIAQSLKIKDTETNEFLEETPENYILFGSPKKWISNLFKDPLVLATYEEGEEDSEGNIRHAGEYKLNNEGTYYYETLNGRSTLGKQVLSSTDILTKEGSYLNSIDFLDSDDLQKSPESVIIKNIALIAPMFTPASSYYFKAIVAKELAKSLPMLYNMSNLIGDSDNEIPEWMNTIAAKGESLTTGTSQYSKEHVFTLENFANLISDVALQWGQLKEISKAVNYFSSKKQLKKAEESAFKYYKSKVGNSLKGWEAPSDDLWKQSTVGLLALEKFYKPVLETAKKRLRLGADLALAYMAIISNTDVYQTMLLKGATKKEAAWVTLGSTVGMYGVDRYLHLGEMFYDELTDDAIKQAHKALKGEITEAVSNIYQGSEQKGLNLFKRAIQEGKRLGNNFVDNVKNHNLGALGKSLGEGLEEVTEEFVTDTSKAIYSLLGDLGLYEASVKNPIDYDTMMERYLMSFFGGAIGGGLFYFKLKYDGFNEIQDADMADLIRQGKAQMLRDITLNWKDKGKISSTTLSGLKPIRDSETGAIKSWTTTSNKAESQNDIIANKIILKINALESIIMGDKVNLDDDALFDNMVLQETRYRKYKNASHITGYYEEFKHRFNKLLTAETNYREASETADGNPNGPEVIDSKRNDPALKEVKLEKLLALKESVDKAKNDINLFLQGDTSLEYTRKLDFALDPVLNSIFLDLDYTKWLELQDIDLENITPEESIELNKKWNDTVKSKMSNGLLEKGFDSYIKLEKLLTPLLEEHRDKAPIYKSYITQLQNSLETVEDKDNLEFSTFIKNNPLYSMNSRLLDENGIEETEEEYNNRNNRNTPDEILAYQRRLQKVLDLNTLIFQKYILQFENILGPLNYEIDAQTGRTLMQNIKFRVKDLKKDALSYPIFINGSNFDIIPYINDFLLINDNLDNTKEILKALLNNFLTQIKSQINQIELQINLNLPPVKILKSVKLVCLKQSIKTILNSIENESLKELIINLRKIIDSPEISEEQEELTKKELYNLIPEEFKIKEESASRLLEFIINTEIEEDSDECIGDVYTIEEFINQLLDKNSLIYKTASKFNTTYANALSVVLNNLKFPFGKDSKIGILLGVSLEYNMGESAQLQKRMLNEALNAYVTLIKNNPIYNFYKKLLTTIKTPLETLFETINKEVTNDNKELINISKVLNDIYKLYVDSELPTDFILNEGQLKLLDNVEQVLKLIGAYIYSASDVENSLNAFSAPNKRINEFVRNHKDKFIKDWEELPVIDEEYVKLIQTEIGRLQRETYFWKVISNNNDMNKTQRMVNTENIINRLRYEVLKHTAPKLIFTIDDKEYNLGEGLDNLEPFDAVDEEANILKLYNAEKRLYSNFIKITNEAKISPEEFFTKSKFWQKLVGSNILHISQLLTSKLSERMSSITMYDYSIYLLSILSKDPTIFYLKILELVKDENNKIVPLTIQLMLVRLGDASNTKIYKAGFSALSEYIKPNKTVLNDSMYLNGAAGAGKTEVVLKLIKDMNSQEKCLIIGPTSSQAIKLQKTLLEDTSYTFDELDPDNIFKKLVKDWDDINKSYNEALKSFNAEYSKNKPSFTIENDYFSISYNSVPSIGILIKLKPNKIKFSKDFKLKLVFVDEAAWLNPLQLTLLDLYAHSVEGTLYLASDSSLSGNLQGRIENLLTDSVFTTRSSKLTESLRSTNSLKLYNGNKVENLLDDIDLAFNSENVELQKDLLHKLPDIISKFNLKYYIDDTTINGDYFTSNLEEVLNKLPKDAEIGFIGDENSPNYLLLKSLGFTKLSAALTETVVPGKPFMQGLEFDYVIIDSLKELPSKINPNYSSVVFLRRFNTLLTRGKVASIFLDGKNLENLVGKNILDKIKSKGFSILNQLKPFRESVLNKVQSLDLVPISDTFYNKEEQPLKAEEKAVKNTVKEEQNNLEETVTEEIKKELEEEPKVEEEIKEEGKEKGEELLNLKEVEFIEIETPQTEEETPELDPEKPLKTLEEALESFLNEVLLDLNELQEVEKDNTPDELENNNPSITLSFDDDLTIEANTVVPILGVEKVALDPDKPNKIYWRVDPNKTPIRRNLNALINNEKGYILSYEDKYKYLDILSQILSSIIFGGDLKNAPELTNLEGFSDAWKNRKISLSIRPATLYDTIGIGTDLKETFVEIEGKKYILSLTCTLENLSTSIKDTETFSAVFDICMLSDPNKLVLKERLKAIRTHLQNLLDLGSIRKDNIEKVKNFIKNLNKSSQTYKDFIYSIVEEHPDGYDLELDPEEYESHKTTRIVKRLYKRDDGSYGIKSRRLGGKYDIDELDRHLSEKDYEAKEDHRSFREIDPRKKVSSVYILGKKSDLLKKELDSSIFGKAVVFVTNNVNLTETEMIEHYIALKKDPDLHTPEVRLIPLMNHGISFSEFISHKILETLKESKDKSKKPFRMDVLGVRMFASMWNFRAALENFLEVLRVWKEDNNINNLDDILTAEALLFEMSRTELKDDSESWLNNLPIEDFRVQNILSKNEVSLEDIFKLSKFNLEICQEIPIFRLGKDYTKNSIGGYVRSFDTSKSNVYGKKRTNLIAIDPEYANKYYNILSTILEQLTKNKPDDLYTRIGFDYKPMNTTLMKSDGITPYKTNEYISLKDLKRNLSGLIHTVDGKIVLRNIENNKIVDEITIPSKAIFSFFPKAISTIISKARVYQTNDSMGGLLKISTIVNNDTKEDFNFDIAELFKENMLRRSGSDNTLFNLFNLIFHGTAQDIHSPHAYTEEAPFKYGIFIDSDLEYSAEYKDLNYGGINGKDYVLLKCGTKENYFYVNIDVRPGGISLNLSKIILKVKDSKKNPIAPPRVLTNTRFSENNLLPLEELECFLLYLDNNFVNPEEGDTEEDYKIFYKEFVETKLNELFTSGINTSDPSFNIIWYINTINNKLIEENGILGTSVQEIEWDPINEIIKFKDSEGNSGLLSYEDKLISIKYDENTPLKNLLETDNLNSLDSVVLGSDGAPLCSHKQFIDAILDSIEDHKLGVDLLKSSLLNCVDLNNLKTIILENYESLSNCIGAMNDISLLNTYTEYLLSMMHNC